MNKPEDCLLCNSVPLFSVCFMIFLMMLQVGCNWLSVVPAPGTLIHRDAFLLALKWQCVDVGTQEAFV